MPMSRYSHTRDDKARSAGNGTRGYRKSVQTNLLIRHSMNPRRSPFPGGHVANDGTSGKRLFPYRQRALPCAAKYTGRQRFQERMPICVTVKLQADGCSCSRTMYLIRHIRFAVQKDGRFRQVFLNACSRILLRSFR